jgi:hypothetical protein
MTASRSAMRRATSVCNHGGASAHDWRRWTRTSAVASMAFLADMIQVPQAAMRANG